MCGIAGRFGKAPLPTEFAATLADRLEQPLRPRGPDGLGIHHDRDVLLVHRRLAIQDLSDAGRQPMWNEDGTVCVIVNGEIYNFIDLRRALEGRGHRFRSRSDSEVLVHLYEDRGIDGCSAAEGMFAYALWDARKRDLYLVRDRLGIKPLVIAEHREGVTFGSTVPAVLADPAVPRDPRHEALAAVLKWGFVPSPWSAIKAVRHVMPGTWIRLRDGAVQDERRWWTDEPVDAVTTEEQVRGAVEDAVRSHLVADVPIGALLSAGIDSGLVTALAARMLGPGGLEAWTASHAGFQEDEFGEAWTVGSRLGVTVHEVPIGGQGLTEGVFETLIDGMDEPLAVSSLVGLHGLFRGISSDRRVVLSGDGGDELFAGYDWHHGMPAVPRWAHTDAFRAAAPLFARVPTSAGRIGGIASVARHIRQHPASIYLNKLRIATDAELREMGIDPRVDGPAEAHAIAAWDRFAPAGTLEQMLAIDRATALVDEMFAKLDTSSMAYSIEARVPLIADRVRTAAMGLRPDRKRQGTLGKICLRDWYRELIPDGLAMRRKTGFNSPLAHWLRGTASDLIREHARAGLALLDGSDAGRNPRVTFACAVIGAWAQQRVGDTRAAIA